MRYNNVRMTRLYEEVIEFIADCDPVRVAKYQASVEARQRVAYLLARMKDDSVTPEEAAELEKYRNLEHIMRLAKAHARQRLSHE